MPPPRKVDAQTTLEVYLKNGGNKTHTARELGVHRRTIDRHLAELGMDEKPLMGGSVKSLEHDVFDFPAKGKVKYYFFSSAQNNTYVHEEFFGNILAFKEYYDAELHISTFKYNKQSFQNVKLAKGVLKGAADTLEDVYYDPKIEPYVSDHRALVAPGLMWCGEMQMLPTDARPLSAMATYTGRNSGIFPHAKIAMESVAAMPGEDTKFNYTTGTCTLKNYIQRKAGLKGEFHHCYAFLLVEVNSDGNWWCRQVNATENGSFYDLDTFVENGKVTTGHRIAGFNPGDTHVSQIDPVVEEVTWGKGGIVETLDPEVEFHNDLLDSGPRNHHEDQNCHRGFAKFVSGKDVVEDEIVRTAEWLKKRYRKGRRLVVVDSNHDGHLERWLRDADFKEDHPNALFYLRAQLEMYTRIKNGDKNFHLIEWVFQEAGVQKDIKFLRDSESYVICPDEGGGIECGLHGHQGVNGSRGTPRGFIKLGRKTNTGHTHAASIHEGVYTAGTCSLLRLSYNSGPSNWSHSHVITHKNGKRQIITIFNGRWRA